MTKASNISSLSKVFHERVRLGIMTLLISKTEGVDFNEMIETLQLTKGNCSVHVSKLEEAGYVDVIKEFVGKTPRTTYFATEQGRTDFATYLEILEELIQHAKENL